MSNFGVSVALETMPELNNEIKDRIKQALGKLSVLGIEKTTTNDPQYSFTTRLGPIDMVVGEWSEIIKPTTMGGGLPFRFWQCESLINQAIDLLERCLSDRTRYDALRERYVSSWIELESFLLNDNVRESQKKSTRRQLQKEILEKKIADAEALEKYVRESASNIDKHLSSDVWNIEVEANLKAEIDKLRGMNPYSKFHTDGGSWTIINERPIIDVILEKNFTANKHEMTRQRLSVEMQKHSFVHEKNIAYGRQASISKEILDNDIEFEDKSHNAERIGWYFRALAMTEAGGSLNHLEQMIPVQLRFLRDLADAYARLVEVDKGMQNIYGYPFPLPNPSEFKTRDRSFLDACVAWSRNVVAFITRFAQRDQVLAVPFSLRRLLDLNWQPDSTSDGEIRFRFRFPSKILDDAFYPRLRGIALYVVPKDGVTLNGVFQARVSPPAMGRTRFFDDADTYIPLKLKPAKIGDLEIPSNIVTPWQASTNFQARSGYNTINQKDAPAARIGRVQPRNSYQGSDVVGAVTFANISPIGVLDNTHDAEWEIRLNEYSSQGESFAVVAQDLEVEIHVAYQERWR